MLRRDLFKAACGLAAAPLVGWPSPAPTTRIWRGGDDWNDPRNWNPHGTPCPGDTVVVETGDIVIDLDVQTPGGPVRVGRATYRGRASATIGADGKPGAFSVKAIERGMTTIL